MKKNVSGFTVANFFKFIQIFSKYISNLFLLFRPEDKPSMQMEMPVIKELLLVGLGIRNSRPYIMVYFMPLLTIVLCKITHESQEA